MHRTKIDYADFTWNPVWGCLRGCPYCYAAATARRWGIPFAPHWRERNFAQMMPRQPSRIFVNSMSDIEFWTRSWWDLVLGRIRAYPEHAFLFLTKRPEVYFNLELPPNCWLGVTVTGPRDFDLHYVDALQGLRNRKFISYEPMLQWIDPSWLKIWGVWDWVILGAESGNRPGRVVPPPEWIQPWLQLELPLFMKRNLPWSGPWRKEFPDGMPEEMAS